MNFTIRWRLYTVTLCTRCYSCGLDEKTSGEIALPYPPVRSIGHPRKHAIQSNLVVLGPLVVFRFPHSPIPPCPVGFKIALPLSNSAGVFWVYMPNPPPMSSAYLVSHLFLVGDLPQVLIADYHTGHLIPRIKRRHLLTNTCCQLFACSPSRSQYHKVKRL